MYSDTVPGDKAKKSALRENVQDVVIGRVLLFFIVTASAMELNSLSPSTLGQHGVCLEIEQLPINPKGSGHSGAV